MQKSHMSYAREIYLKIKSDILKLRIKDGEFITLSELANKYNVSKTPIRDALTALELEGYLTSFPRKGYFVKPITEQNMQESFEMRMIFEKESAKKAILKASDEELKSILHLAEKFPDNFDVRKIDEFNYLNDKFHMSIIKAGHNEMLYQMAENVFENLSRILIYDSRHLLFSNEKQEHINIASEMLNRNIDSAQKLICDHLVHLQKRVYENKKQLMEASFYEKNTFTDNRRDYCMY
ncbi:GntR family transcriptional regulator [Clostridium sp. BJN0001]|uniref:GntR family transcriptional regulator n=1 Tax=Clostridium sp. BJN0001 TaxID=2930219 RepID=UPI001FD13FDC|nr:GntR family transcriptional regulator [Clostridium sp. BJN0001]